MTTQDRYAEAKRKGDEFLKGAAAKIEEFLKDPQYRCRGCGAHSGAWLTGLAMDDRGQMMLGGVRYPGPELAGWGQMSERFGTLGEYQSHMWCPDCRKKKDL
jgi:rubredoxin